MTAFITTALPAGNGIFFGRVSHAAHELFIAAAAWNSKRKTRKELQQLTDIQLDDIGLCRADIYDL